LFKLKENNIQKKTKKLQKLFEKRNVQIKPVQKIAVLNNPTSNLNFENLKLVQKTLGLKSSQFEIFTFKNKNDHYNELRGIVASKDVFSTFGKIKSPEIIEFLKKDFDLLLDFTGMSNLYEKYFSLAIKANYRVGYFHPEELYDLMLNIKKGDIDNFASETYKYLTIIGLLK